MNEEEELQQPPMNLFGAETGPKTGASWMAPDQNALASLKDGDVVAIAKKGIARQAKWNAATGKFTYENEHNVAKHTGLMKFGDEKISNDIEGAVDLGPKDEGGSGIGSLMLEGKYKKTMEVAPDQVDAIGIGESPLMTAGKTALKSAPSSAAGLYAFMRTMSATKNPVLGAAAGVVTSALTSAGVSAAQEATGILSQTEQDQINSVVNPTATTIGGYIPTLLAFRPSASVLKAAAGFESGVAGSITQKQALETIGKGGLMNLGIAQGGAMVDPLLHGSPDPSINRFEASARTIGMGDPTKEFGGGLGDRISHAGKELAIGGLLLHKPWGVGSLLHNAAHTDPAQKVKLSGAPTFEALKAQEAQALALRAAKIAKEMPANVGVNANEVAQAQKLTSAEQTGVDQIKAALTVALQRKIIDKETHDTANVVADTLGREMLQHIQLSQVGRADGTSLGSATEAGQGEGVFNAVKVFASAINTGRFKHTLFHEVSHPLFDSLSREKQNSVLADLVAEREAARKQNRGLDYILTKMGVKNTDRWSFDSLTLTDREMAAIEHDVSGETWGEIKRMFELRDDTGVYRLRPNFVDGKAGKDFSSTKRLYRLMNVREFFSEEAARVMSSRGEYDKKWGAIKDYDVIAFMKSAYHGMKKALQGTKYGKQLIGGRSAVDVIIDSIAEGNFKNITESGVNKIQKDALSVENASKIDAAVRETDIDANARDIGIGEILAGYNEASSRKNQVGEAMDAELGRTGFDPGAQSIRDKIRNAGDEVVPSRVQLSEDDAQPSLPDASKAALKKLGIKDTVINNIVRHSAIGHIKSSFDTIQTAEHAVHVFRNTSVGTQESIQLLVTDKNGRPLEIYRQTLSEPGASAYSPLGLIAQALSVKGAKNVWMSHNHPSQTPAFSASDRQAYNAVGRMLEGSGLKYSGFFAIAGDRAVTMDPSMFPANPEGLVSIPPPPAPGTGKRIPLIERLFSMPRGGPEDHLSTVKASHQAAQRQLVNDLLGNEPGIVFLDRNQMSVGSQKITPQKMMNLGEDGVRNLLAAFSRSGADTILLSVGGDTISMGIRKASAENIANMLATKGGNARSGTTLRNVISNDAAGQEILGAQPQDLIKNLAGDGAAGFKSEDDFSSEPGHPVRGEQGGTRVGVGGIKPLNKAPSDQFPIPASSLKRFGITRGTLEQFSDHAIVKHINTGVTNVRTAGDVASLIYDYSGTKAQGETLLLVVGDNGEPIQVGLHMLDKSSGNTMSDVMTPMFGVLAGKALSTPGAREAWMIRVNNDFVPGEQDAAVKNEEALKNLLEGSGVNYRGLVTVSGRKYSSREYQQGMHDPSRTGEGKFVPYEVGFMPIQMKPKTDTIPLTERRYTSRSQIPFDEGVKMKDRALPNEDLDWKNNPDTVRTRLNAVFAGDPGVMFMTSSGRTAASIPMTLAEMADIRGTEAHKSLLAVMDRAGVNWGFVTIGDAPRTPETLAAVSNASAFLKQMGLKIIDTFNETGVIDGNPNRLGDHEWKSEDDATPDIKGGYSDLRSKTGLGVKPPRGSLKLDPVEARVAGISSLDFKINDQQLSRHVLQRHLADFESIGIELGKTRDEQVKNLRDIITQSIDSREGIARIGQGVEGGFGARSDGSKDSRISVFSTYGNNPIQMVFEATPSGNELITAFPIDQAKFRSIKSHPTYKPSKGRTEQIDYERAKPLRRMQADAGAQHPESQIPGPVRGQNVSPPPADPVRSSDPAVGGKYAGARRGMLKPTAFSEDDAAEANKRAERLMKPDSIVGPEAIRGDFRGWVESLKELANEHLYQHPFPGNSGDYEGDVARDKSRAAKHAIIDQVYAKLTKQKGFNPMTLKPGMLSALRTIEHEIVLQSFKELSRFAVNVHQDSMSNDPAHDADTFQQWKYVKNIHEPLVDIVRMSMETGMTSKETGLEIIDMANEIRSSSLMTFDDYRKRTGGNRNNYSEDDAGQSYEGLAFSEADVRKWESQTPAERTAFINSLPDKKNRDEYRIMLESMRKRDFDNRPGAPERRAKHEARRQEIIEKYKAQGHPFPDMAADRELNPRPTGQDPEDRMEQVRQQQSDKNKLNSEDDAENIAMTSFREVANHSNPDLADRGFLTREASKMPKKLAKASIKFKHGNGRLTVRGVDEEGFDWSGSMRFGEKKIAVFEATQEDGVVTLDWIKVNNNFRGNGLSKVILAEIIERAKRTGEGDDFYSVVLDPLNRPISALERLLGKENVEWEGGDIDSTDGRDQFRQADPDTGEWYIERKDLSAKIPNQYSKKELEILNNIRKGFDVDKNVALWVKIKANNSKLLSEDDAENMRIPGGARDEALKARPTKERIRMVYTDIGHPEGKYFKTSLGVASAMDADSQYLWAYNTHGEFKMISVEDLYQQYHQLRRKKKYGKGGQLLMNTERVDLTHGEWSQVTGDEWDHRGVGSGRVDELHDGSVRMSWAPGKKMYGFEGENDIRTFKGEEIKAEAAAFLDLSGKRAGKMAPEKIKGYRWDPSSYNSDPSRFSEDDAENGRFPNQNRARGKIPDARVRNGETDLGFTLKPGEELDADGLILRKNTIGDMYWGGIGHEAEFWTRNLGLRRNTASEAVVADAIESGNLQELAAYSKRPGYENSYVVKIDSRLFGFNSETGEVELGGGSDSTHLAEWGKNKDAHPSSRSGDDEGFGSIEDNMIFLGRIEPALIGKDGTLLRRGRISLARNDKSRNWIDDVSSMDSSQFPSGMIKKIKAAAVEATREELSRSDFNDDPFTPKQYPKESDFDVFGFGMAKEKKLLGYSPKDTGPLLIAEEAKTYRDLAQRPIGEGKDGQKRLNEIASRLSEDDANQVSEPPFRVPNAGPGRTNIELARDIATARFFTGISDKAHTIADEYPASRTAKQIANMIHARAGAETGVTGLDMPTSIMTERTKNMNQFFEIMGPLRGEFASMSRADRETAYRQFADMITGNLPIDISTTHGRAAERLKTLLKDLHDYRTAAGEKIGEVEDYFPAVYDSFRISVEAQAFKEDAKQAYMIDLAHEFQGQELEDMAEKRARELTLSHVRGEGEGQFNSFFEESTPALGENSSKSRKFSRDAQEIMSKWQIKDPYRVISRYISAATKRAEITRRLGDEGQQWRKMAAALEREGVSYEKIDELSDLLKSSVGIGRKPNSKGEQTYIDLMGLYTAGSVMGRSFLNNMFEPASMGIRSGNLALGLQAYGETWGRTIHNAVRVLSGEKIDKTFWDHYGEHIGTISADINDAWMNSHSIEVDGDRSDPRISWLTSKVYQSNLLQITENAKLQASHAIGFKYLTGLAEMQQGKSFMNRFDVTESVRSNLRELGIPDADHGDFAAWMIRVSKLNDAGRIQAMTSGGKMSKLFDKAMIKFSVQSSVRANRAHKPVFQDGPIGKTLFQLMSYSYSYGAEVNSRVYGYAKSAVSSAPAGKSYSVGDRIRFMAPLMMAPMGIIAYRAMFALKDELYPTEYSEKHKNDPAWMKWMNAASYANIFGPKVEMATKYVMRDQPPGGPAGQTAIGTARAAKTAVSNVVEGKPQDNAIRQAAKASVQPIKAAAVIGATAVHPAAGVVASQVANSTSWSNAMTEKEKAESDKKEGPQPYKPYKPQK